MSKRNYPLRIEEILYDEIEKISKERRRSVNFIINELLEESLKKDKIDIKDFIVEDMKIYCKKANITVSEHIEQIWKAFKKTYK